MTVVLIFVLIFQAMTLAGVLTLMEEKQQKDGRKQKTNVYRKMGELEARRILRDLANEMTTTAEETAAIDTALNRQWCYLDGPCEYGNEEIRIPEETEEKNMGLHDGFVGRLKEEIKAESANGYKGLVKVFDRGFEKRFELFIFDFRGHEVLHSYAGNVKTKKELQEAIDTFPEFLRALRAGGEND